MIVKKKAKAEPIILGPNPNCKTCYGRGWVRYFIPNNDSKEVRPCSCVRAKVTEFPDGEAELSQYIH